jgi:hypothetical protein
MARVSIVEGTFLKNKIRKLHKIFVGILGYYRKASF